jgi:uncharacterized coiled-coil protein SlyX
MISNQNKVIDTMSRKIASNDKLLENINTRMDSFTSTIKNQHSFNKMIESQISQLVASVPVTERGKIPGKTFIMQGNTSPHLQSNGEHG